MGRKFRRQHPIGNYIVDFYCHEVNLVVEADGFVHLNEDVAQYDKDRTDYLNDLGLTVLRFTNDEIIQQTSFVLKIIRRHL